MTSLVIARLPAGSPLWLLALALGMLTLHAVAAWLVRIGWIHREGAKAGGATP